MPAFEPHPPLDELEAYGLGRISEADSLAIEFHLAECEACCLRLEQVPDDALVCLLHVNTGDTYVAYSAATNSDLSFPRPESPASDFAAPRDLAEHGRYLVLGTLGVGGMGTVYKARHRLMDRVVALKVVNPVLINKPGAVERFTREVRAAAKLVHPNIVTAYDAEKAGDTHLLVMEFVEGRTLAQVQAEQSQLPIREACEYLRQTALGLQHALVHGMVHRDIKPQNLMLTSAGEIKILDFGLARFVREQTQSIGATEVGMLMGSPDYMAPEQGHDAHTADTRSDIYGMGCTLYHLLAGQTPFPATSLLGKLEAHRDKQAVSLRQLRPETPVELARVVEKMMAKDPARRYQTPAEVAQALQVFARVDQTVAAPQSARTSTYASIVAVVLALAAFAYWAGGTIFRVETPQGTLIVKTDDPDVQISVKSGGKEVLLFFPERKMEVPLRVGEYTLELVGGKDGLKLSTNRFEIEADDPRKTVSVEFVPAATGDKNAPPQPAAEKRAAKFAFALGGKVRVDDQARELTDAADLPPDPFRLTALLLSHNPRVTDAGLVHFKRCKHLMHLDLGAYLGDRNANVTDTGLANFQDCENLTMLSLGGTRVSNAGLGYFKNCKRLFTLHLDNTQIGDDGLANFRDVNLGTLSLSGTQVTDAGLSNFKNCKNLYWLWLADTNVGNEGLTYFQNRPELRYLILSGTQLSDEGLGYFKDCKHLAQFLLENTRVSDEGLSHCREMESVTQLSLAKNRIGDAGLANFKKCLQMKELFLAETEVSDASVPQIKDYVKLEELQLQKTKFTAEGIAELRTALPKCKIEWDD